jgi:hypothetical protein
LRSHSIGVFAAFNTLFAVVITLFAERCMLFTVSLLAVNTIFFSIFLFLLIVIFCCKDRNAKRSVISQYNILKLKTLRILGKALTIISRAIGN